MGWKIVCGLLLLFSVWNVECVYKRWKSNTDFDDPHNWDKGHLPCPNDQIRFPDNVPIVALNQDWTILDMTLPLNGMLILNDNMNIVFNSNPTVDDPRCTGQVITYNRTHAEHWLDPDNWCVPEFDFDRTCWDKIDLLDLEKIPCVYDDVIFPGLLDADHRSSFYVNLGIIQDMDIRSLQIGKTHHNTESFAAYVQSEIGSKEFIRGLGHVPPTIRITSRFCQEERAGCYCGYSQSPWKQSICSFKPCNTPAPCLNPITPEGACCPMCGGMIQMAINSTMYSKIAMRNMIENDFINDQTKNYTEVKIITSRLQDGTAQITAIDKSQGNVAAALSAEVNQRIEQNKQTYGVLFISNYQVSGIPPTTQPTTLSTTPSTQPTKKPITKQSTIIPTKKTTPKSPKTTGKPPQTNAPVTGAQATPGAVIATSHDSLMLDNRQMLIFGAVVTGVTVLLLACVGYAFCGGYKSSNESQTSPLSVSIKFDDTESGNGTVEMTRGASNPLYEEEEDGNAIPMEQLEAGVSGVKTAPMSKRSKKTTKKPSTGFDNPIFFDSKTETVGTTSAGEPSQQRETDFTVTNPLYDSTFRSLDDGETFDDHV